MNKRLQGSKSEKGAALMWVVVMMMIVTVFLAIIATTVASYANRQAYARDTRQAYLSARSVCDAVIASLTNGTEAAKIITNNSILPVGRSLEVEDITFHAAGDKERIDPANEMKSVTATIERLEELKWKVRVTAQVGKGKKTIARAFEGTKGTAGGSQNFWTSDFQMSKSESLFTGDEVDVVTKGNLISYKDGHIKMGNLSNTGGKGSNLIVQGNVELIRSYPSEDTMYIKGKIRSGGDVQVKNLKIHDGIDAKGKVTLKSSGNSKLTVVGDIVCEELIIETPAIWEGGYVKLVGNIYTDKDITVKTPEGDVKISPTGSYIYENPTSKRVLVEIIGSKLAGVSWDDVAYAKWFEQPQPSWVENWPQATIEASDTVIEGSDEVMVSTSNGMMPVAVPKDWQQQLLTPNQQYILRGKSGSQFEIVQIIRQFQFENNGQRGPITFIIPAGTNVELTQPLPANADGKPDFYFILQPGAKLKLADGDNYMHIYGSEADMGWGPSEIILRSHNFYGTLVGGTVNARDWTTMFHYVQDILGGTSSEITFESSKLGVYQRN